VTKNLEENKQCSVDLLYMFSIVFTILKHAGNWNSHDEKKEKKEKKKEMKFTKL